MASSPRSRVVSASQPRRLGQEVPRIFTPPLRKLTARTSHGFSVIEFADSVLEIDLYPWQRWLLIHALELLPDDSFRFRTIVVLVARQNGKSTLSTVLSLWFLYVYGYQLVIGTAQDLDVAEEIWQHSVDLVEETPELNALKERVVKVNGQKSLELKTGQRYKVKAANRRAGRGLSGDLILLDELREHTSWDSWGAITKTTMARPNAQIWALSNAGDAASIVLRYLRKMAHLALGDPDRINAKGIDDPAADDDAEIEIDDEDTLGIFEWSAPPGCETDDRDGWAMANPSLGYSITERTVSSAQRTDPEWVFRTEVLCQWSEGTSEGPFPPGAWAARCDPTSNIAAGSKICAAVDVSWDRTMSHVAIAAKRADGDFHTEIVASRAGTAWVVPWLTGVNEDGVPRKFDGLVIQSNGAPVSSLGEEMEAAGLPMIACAGADLGKAAGQLMDLVKLADMEPANPGDPKSERRPVPKVSIWHLPQPVLDVAAQTARTRPLGDMWVFDRRHSSIDCSPLIAVAGAAWGLSQIKVPFRSRYEDEGASLLVL